MTNEVELEIPFKFVPSLNTLLNMHFRTKHDLKEEVRSFVHSELREKYGKIPRFQKAKLTLKTYYCGVCRDYDNIVGGAKLLVDAFTDKVVSKYKKRIVTSEGVLPDDSYKVIIERDYNFVERVKTRKDAKFIITLKEIK